MARFETERTVADREQLFLGALADGRTLPSKPTIQDLDRYARLWADLVPEDVQVRAAVLKRVVDKYGLPEQAGAVRTALGAGDPTVQAAYQRQAGLSLAEAEVRPLSRRERFSWWRAGASRRLENLPPFWLAYVLTLTETVGGGILALPIAFAGLGPVGATVLLVAFGLINTLTVAALVESITRDGRMRYGDAFFGRLIGDYLGRPGNLVALPALLAFDAVGFCVALVGFGTTLAAATGLPVLVPAAALFGVVVVVLWRRSLDATVALAVVVGTTNIAILLVISAIAAGSARPEGFAGWGSGLVLNGGLLELIFGVALVAYFGHTSAGHAAKVVLARDPSGRHLLAGNVAAMLTATVVVRRLRSRPDRGRRGQQPCRLCRDGADPARRPDRADRRRARHDLHHPRGWAERPVPGPGPVQPVRRADRVGHRRAGARLGWLASGSSNSACGRRRWPASSSSSPCSWPMARSRSPSRST